MRIDILTLGGPGRGMGHITRTLALAQALKNLGHICIFRLPDSGGKQLLMRSGFQCLEQGAEKWGQPGLEIPDLFVVDHYDVSSDYFGLFMEKAPVVYIDDLCLERYPVSGIVNGHFYAEDLPYRNLYGEILLMLGTEYCLLRPEYASVTAESSEQITNILVTTGGTDPQQQMTTLLQEALAATEGTTVTVHGVIGPGFEEIDILCRQMADEPRISLHHQPETLAPLMARCQLAISAAGTTLYELAAFGIPALIWQMVENQKYVYKSAIRQGMARGFSPDAPGSLTRVLAETLADGEWLKRTGALLRNRVDGEGAARAAKTITQYFTNGEK